MFPCVDSLLKDILIVLLDSSLPEICDRRTGRWMDILFVFSVLYHIIKECVLLFVMVIFYISVYFLPLLV